MTRHRADPCDLSCEIERTLYHYISSKLAVSIIAGIAVGLVYDILGVQLAFLIGFAF